MLSFARLVSDLLVPKCETQSAKYQFARSFTMLTGFQLMIGTITFAYNRFNIFHRYLHLTMTFKRGTRLIMDIFKRQSDRYAQHTNQIKCFTLSTLSGFGNNSYFSSHSCSMVISIFRSFNKTNHNLCKSELDFRRSSSAFHARPHRTSLLPQFFLSSKNSIRSRRDDVV